MSKVMIFEVPNRSFNVRFGSGAAVPMLGSLTRRLEILGDHSSKPKAFSQSS